MVPLVRMMAQLEAGKDLRKSKASSLAQAHAAVREQVLQDGIWGGGGQSQRKNRRRDRTALHLTQGPQLGGPYSMLAAAGKRRGQRLPSGQNRLWNTMPDLRPEQYEAEARGQQHGQTLSHGQRALARAQRQQSVLGRESLKLNPYVGLKQSRGSPPKPSKQPHISLNEGTSPRRTGGGDPLLSPSSVRRGSLGFGDDAVPARQLESAGSIQLPVWHSRSVASDGGTALAMKQAPEALRVALPAMSRTQPLPTPMPKRDGAQGTAPRRNRRGSAPGSHPSVPPASRNMVASTMGALAIQARDGRRVPRSAMPPDQVLDPKVLATDYDGVYASLMSAGKRMHYARARQGSPRRNHSSPGRSSPGKRARPGAVGRGKPPPPPLGPKQLQQIRLLRPSQPHEYNPVRAMSPPKPLGLTQRAVSRHEADASPLRMVGALTRQPKEVVHVSPQKEAEPPPEPTTRSHNTDSDDSDSADEPDEFGRYDTPDTESDRDSDDSDAEERRQRRKQRAEERKERKRRRREREAARLALQTSRSQATVDTVDRPLSEFEDVPPLPANQVVMVPASGKGAFQVHGVARPRAQKAAPPRTAAGRRLAQLDREHSMLQKQQRGLRREVSQVEQSVEDALRQTKESLPPDFLFDYRMKNFTAKHDDAGELIRKILNRLTKGKLSQAWAKWLAIVAIARKVAREKAEAKAGVHITRVGKG